MKNLDTVPRHLRPGWQILGEIEVPVDSTRVESIHTWIIEILDALNLQVDFLQKISTSAQEAAGRALRNDTVLTWGHIHLIVIAPADIPARQGTWGFFRIEKIENGTSESSPAHAIEIYLYRE